MLSWKSLAVCAAIVSGSRASVTSPSPTPTPSTQQGWYSAASNSWSPVMCDPGESRQLYSTFARCCSDYNSNCPFATSCDSSVLSFWGGATMECDTGSTCANMKLYPDPHNTTASFVDMWCASSWTASTIFMDTTAAPTPTGEGNVAVHAATPAASVSKSGAAATSTDSGNNDTSSKHSGSKAWIAGAVVGPVAGCAIIGALGFWLGNRKKQQALAEKHVHMGGFSSTGPSNSTEYGSSRGFGELDPQSRPHELDSRANLAELPAAKTAP
ncbi:hypothetical protein NUU61_000819 [Penicillium alfredii]|uniref:Mid2 domain-containing protein n=1 Tax=Penicillium alfredii TaxID=1506179 RepID=A0A9W9GA99_9EURO|nr:uncharacterized protein NUU61_000819 [Penicillium alfredii]KAJ5115060.1 hypothetical protein NUU61_000819 [Penicillium alfredii]